MTAEFAKEGALSRSKLVQAFEDTKKFCIPDGRSLPKDCFVKKEFGISYAPNLSGRLLRHYDSGSGTDSSGSRSLGDTQSDSLEKHDHKIDTSSLRNLKGRLISDYYYIRRDYDWSTGSANFVTGIDYGDSIGSWRYPSSWTEYTGSDGTRPKNTCYISFYRYDW
ncbi:hypothetical protein QIA36_05350 (plasmid) [Borreliella yangtzensis]|uniref:hypothetical protein n=1 Tax=Borreliella yangtzensis TaxID=683292 RepID=UPI003B220B15